MLDLPVVHHKDKEDQFEWKKIMYSLIKETGLKQEIAKEVAIEVYRFIITNNLKIVTGPMLREISNFFLLTRSLERERARNSRVGYPPAVLKEILMKGSDINGTISRHVISEFYALDSIAREIDIREWFEQWNAVRKLIGECEEKG